MYFTCFCLSVTISHHPPPYSQSPSLSKQSYFCLHVMCACLNLDSTPKEACNILIFFSLFHSHSPSISPSSLLSFLKHFLPSFGWHYILLIFLWIIFIGKKPRFENKIISNVIFTSSIQWLGVNEICLWCLSWLEQAITFLVFYSHSCIC